MVTWNETYKGAASPQRASAGETSEMKYTCVAMADQSELGRDDKGRTMKDESKQRVCGVARRVGLGHACALGKGHRAFAPTPTFVPPPLVYDAWRIDSHHG